MSRLSVVQALPDGSWAEAPAELDVVESLRAFDPRMRLLKNLAQNAWEVWKTFEDGRDVRLCYCPIRPGAPEGSLPDTRFLLAFLSERSNNPIARIMEQNRANSERIVNDAVERIAEYTPELQAAVRADNNDSTRRNLLGGRRTGKLFSYSKRR